MKRLHQRSLLFASCEWGWGMAPILYTALSGKRDATLAGVERDCVSDSAKDVSISGTLGLCAQEIRSLITNKRRKKSGLIRRLTKMDQELRERYADIGAKGEPSLEGNRPGRWV